MLAHAGASGAASTTRVSELIEAVAGRDALVQQLRFELCDDGSCGCGGDDAACDAHVHLLGGSINGGGGGGGSNNNNNGVRLSWCARFQRCAAEKETLQSLLDDEQQLRSTGALKAQLEAATAATQRSHAAATAAAAELVTVNDERLKVREELGVHLHINATLKGEYDALQTRASALSYAHAQCDDRVASLEAQLSRRRDEHAFEKKQLQQALVRMRKRSFFA
jgi:hypothetical protein